MSVVETEVENNEATSVKSIEVMNMNLSLHDSGDDICVNYNKLEETSSESVLKTYEDFTDDICINYETLQEDSSENVLETYELPINESCNEGKELGHALKINWLTGDVKQLDPEADFLTFEESVNRLFIGAFILTFFFLIIAVVLCCQYVGILNSKNHVQIIQKVSASQAQRKYPVMPHIMKILKNETVFHIEFDFQNGIMNEDILLQLPMANKHNYFAMRSGMLVIAFVQQSDLI